MRPPDEHYDDAVAALAEVDRLHALIVNVWPGDHPLAPLVEAIGALTAATQAVAHATLAVARVGYPDRPTGRTP